MITYECQDCGTIFNEEDKDNPEGDKGFRTYIHHIHERVAPGEPMPAGTCNKCGALVHEVLEQPEQRHVSSDNCIQLYYHCRQCIEAMPPGETPASWCRLHAGFTDIGLQVWCVRHDCNVVHIDFEGCQHPANTGRRGATQ